LESLQAKVDHCKPFFSKALIVGQNKCWYTWNRQEVETTDFYGTSVPEHQTLLFQRVGLLCEIEVLKRTNAEQALHTRIATPAFSQ